MAEETPKPKTSGRTGGRGLGRGLGALIVNTERAPDPASEQTTRPDPASAQSGGQGSGQGGPRTGDSPPPDTRATSHAGGSVDAEDRIPGSRLVAVDKIEPNPHQPRTHFEPEALQELAASIRAHGIIQPLIVTQSPDQPGRYWLVAGERRWRAAQLAQLAEVPVNVREATPQQLLEWALVENIQRADLNALEEAAAYQSLIDEFAFTQADIGRRVGKSRSAVANTLRLLHLPREAQEALLEQSISPGHARALLALEDPDKILAALEQILDRELSVRQTEDLVRKWLAEPRQPLEPEAEDPAEQDHVNYLENRFRNALGTRVNLNRNRDGSGRLVVHFYNDEDLAGIYHLIAGDDEHL